jgi:hypothetical protein
LRNAVENPKLSQFCSALQLYRNIADHRINCGIAGLQLRTFKIGLPQFRNSLLLKYFRNVFYEETYLIMKSKKGSGKNGGIADC